MSRVLVVAASLVAALSLSRPVMGGETPGLDGFALCTSKAPKEMGYVESDPVYLSAVFQVHANNANYQRAYATFLKQKYRFSGPLNCSVAYAKGDQVKTLDQRAQMVGSLAVRTGWVFANAGAAPAPAATPAAPNNTTAAGSMYFVCSWPTSAAGVLTYYVSDVNGLPPGVDAGPFLGRLAPAFARFVTARYHATGGAFNCVYQFSRTAAEALKKRDLTTAAPKGYRPVDTGWVYGALEP